MTVCDKRLDKLCGDPGSANIARLQEERRMDACCTERIGNILQGCLIHIGESEKNTVRRQTHIPLLLLEEKFIKLPQGHEGLPGGFEERKVAHECVGNTCFISAIAEDGESKLLLPHDECRE